MNAMSVLRWVLVFLFYLAADLSSPVMLTPLEAFDGEAEESIHRAGHRRNRLLAPNRHQPGAATTNAVLARPRPTPAAPRVEAFDGAARKVPAPAADSASSPEDH
jgi:hypothetical protein